jgi:hypothetical protein
LYEKEQYGKSENIELKRNIINICGNVIVYLVVGKE